MIRPYEKNNFTVSPIKILDFFVRFSLICFGIISLYYSVAGARVYLYEVIGLITIVGLICYFFKVNVHNRYNFLDVKILIVFFAVLFFVDMTSSIGVLMGGNAEVLTQHFKGIFKAFFLAVFLIVFLVFNAITDFRYSVKYINILCLMVLLSCLYQFVYLICLLMFGLNIDVIVWPALSFGGSIPEESSTLGSETFIFARHGGFSQNANMLVTQILCVLPYVVLMSVKVSKRYIALTLIFVVSILLTLSRSGFVGLFMIICCIPFVSKKHLLDYVIFILTWGTGFGVLFVLTDSFFDLGFINGIYDLAVARSSDRPYFESARWSLVLAGVDLFEKSPIFGNGLNSSPVLLEGYSVVATTGPDLHNYWMQLFVERGVFSILRVLFYGFILFQCYKFKNIYSQALAVSILCLLVNSMTNNGLAHPFVQLSIVCMYCCCVYGNSISARNSFNS